MDSIAKTISDNLAAKTGFEFGLAGFGPTNDNSGEVWPLGQDPAHAFDEGIGALFRTDATDNADAVSAW
jgi:hypothetical protein